MGQVIAIEKALEALVWAVSVITAALGGAVVIEKAVDAAKESEDEFDQEDTKACADCGASADKGGTDNLEEGQYRDENGRIHNADGTFAPESKDPDARHDRGSEYPHGVKNRDEIIDKYRDENGDVIDPMTGEIIPEDQVTIEHDKKVVEHWNETGKNTGQKERNEWYNDPDNLSVKPRSDNSSEGAKSGKIYDQGTGPNYTPN